MPRQSQKQRISRRRRSQKNQNEVEGGNVEKKNQSDEVVEGGNDGDVKMNNDQNMVHYNKDAKVGGVDPATPDEVVIKDAELVKVPQVNPAPAPTVVSDTKTEGGKRNRKSNKSKKSKKSKKSRKGRK